MSHASDETWEDEVANLYNQRMEGGIKSSPIPQAWTPSTSKNREQAESLKWLGLGEEEGEII